MADRGSVDEERVLNHTPPQREHSGGLHVTGDGPCTAWITAGLTSVIRGYVVIIISVSFGASELDAHSESGVAGAAWPGEAFHGGCFMMRR